MSKGHCILVVQDDIDVSKMLSDYFEALNYETMTAGWGESALEMAEERPPDLVVLDIRLPDMDGFEVCRRLRSHRRTGDVPIIFLTERWERTARLTGLELGAVDYVTKPFDFQELRLRVRNALRRAKLGTTVSPVTGLPTESIIDDELSMLLRQEEWAVLFVGVHGLGEFSDQYGFVAGDDVLRAMALIIKDVARGVSKREPFVGHLGETDFVLISHPSKVGRLREWVTSQLERAIDYFYPCQDREQRPDEHLGVFLTMSVVSADDGPFQSPLELKRLALQKQTVTCGN